MGAAEVGVERGRSWGSRPSVTWTSRAQRDPAWTATDGSSLSLSGAIMWRYRRRSRVVPAISPCWERLGMADAMEGLEVDGHRRLSGDGRYQEGSARQTWLSKPVPSTAQLRVWARRAMEPMAAGPGR